MCTIHRLARAAGVSDNLLQLSRGDHTRVVADMDHVVRPIKMDTRDMRLRAQRLLNGVGTLRAVQRIECERCVLFRVSRGMGHDPPPSHTELSMV